MLGDLALPLPHVLRPAPTQPARPGACSPEELEELVACAKQHCAGLESDDLARCVLRRCSHAAESLSTECLAPAGLIAYGGSLGTALLSTHALEDVDLLVYASTTMNARGAVYARVVVPSVGNLHFFGTHLSPGIHDEQSHQIDELLSWVDGKVSGQHTGEPTVIAGDLNTGPSVGDGGPGHLPSRYRRFVDAGFANPFLDGEDPTCTFCPARAASGSSTSRSPSTSRAGAS